MYVPFIKAKTWFYILIGKKVTAMWSILQEIFIKVFHERQVYKLYLFFGTPPPGENANDHCPWRMLMCYV